MEVKFTRKDPADFYEFNLPEHDLTYRIKDSQDIDGKWMYRLVKFHPSEGKIDKYPSLAHFMATKIFKFITDDEEAVDAFYELTEPYVTVYYDCNGKKHESTSKVIRTLDNNVYVTFDPPLTHKSPVRVVRRPAEEPLTSWCKSFKEAKEDAERAVEQDLENHVDVQMSLF